jgi:hypothetical protein
MAVREISVAQRRTVVGTWLDCAIGTFFKMAMCPLTSFKDLNTLKGRLVSHPENK